MGCPDVFVGAALLIYRLTKWLLKDNLYSMPQKSNGHLIELSLIDTCSREGSGEILREILIRALVDPQNIVESREGFVPRVSTFLKSSAQVDLLKKRLKPFALRDITVRFKKLKAKDWQHKWKEDFHTFSLTKNIDVVPRWENRKNIKGVQKREKIILEPGLAFGTGLHETTKFMSWLIEQNKGSFKTFLDIGTGSGILSLIALKCGANFVQAIDLDPCSVKTARENFRKNGYLKAKIKRSNVAEFKPKERYDFVAANLITQELIRLKKKIISLVKPGGLLAISGISIDNYPFIEKAFQNPPLKFKKIEKGCEWVAVLYQKNGRRK